MLGFCATIRLLFIGRIILSSELCDSLIKGDEDAIK